MASPRLPQNLLESVETRFRPRLIRDWRKAGDATAREALITKAKASAEKVSRRAALIPQIEYDDILPVVQSREEIANAIRDNQVVVLCGDTGSGKTTQLPKICLEMGLGAKGLIGHTQPRRLAARSVASRIADELKSQSAVGYKIRFNDETTANTLVKLMTDGILLAETQTDRHLNQYEVLIIDEAHERSLNIDFLLGFIKQLLPRRPDLKVIITSATIDPDRFSKFFNNAPVIMVEGRTFPVETRYAEMEKDDELAAVVFDQINSLWRESAGDTLIFLPGERDIRDLADGLSKRFNHTPVSPAILPLYSRLASNEQQLIFKPDGKKRRIILATNVAETSLTVPGIKHVIDTGLARISRYSYRSKIQRLPIEGISQASANQRKGRCGRTSAGICVRLYGEDEFNLRDEFTEPEIRRTNLASVILQMHSLGLGDVGAFDFIDPPDSRFIRDGERLLIQLGALNENTTITPYGKDMARLPVDPRMARMLIDAQQRGCLAEMLVIVSALSIQDPRERPMEKQQAADQAQAQFKDARSDFIVWLRLWSIIAEEKKVQTNSEFKRWTQRSFLSIARIFEWREVHSQLVNLCKQLGWTIAASDLSEATIESRYDEIHKAVLTGFIDQLGLRSNDEGKQVDYLGARNTKFKIFPGSSLSKKKTQWIVAAELVETSQNWARCVGAVEPEWIEEVAGPLLKFSYADPRWSKKRGQVIASANISILGLPLASNRVVNYAPVNNQAAYECFVWQALVAGELQIRRRNRRPGPPQFIEDNKALLASLEEIEARHRRRDLIVDDQQIADFYFARLPDKVVDQKSFERWFKVDEHGALLSLSEDDLRDNDTTLDANAFPDHFMLHGRPLKLSYRFEPGKDEDGVTLNVPLPLLNQIDQRRSDWLVPGLLHDKLVGLIKALPKSMRRNFVPAPDYAKAAYARMDKPTGEEAPDLLTELAAALKQITGVPIERDSWESTSLPEHLTMRFKLIDEKEQPITSSRQLDSVREQYGAEAREQVASVTSSAQATADQPAWLGDVTNEWNFGDLEASCEVSSGGFPIRCIPTLKDLGDSVELCLIEETEKATELHPLGCRRLILIKQRNPLKWLEKNLDNLDLLETRFITVNPPPAAREPLVTRALGRVLREKAVLRHDLFACVVDQLHLNGKQALRQQADFEQRCDEARGEVVSHAQDLWKRIDRMLAHYFELRRKLRGLTSLAELAAAADIDSQLNHLVYKGFISDTPNARLSDIPRFLKAIDARLEKLAGAPRKDAEWSRQVNIYWQRYTDASEKQAKRGMVDAGLIEFRWAIEEYRVSLFAQNLGTKQSVSAKRLDALWKAVKN